MTDLMSNIYVHVADMHNRFQTFEKCPFQDWRFRCTFSTFFGWRSTFSKAMNVCYLSQVEFFYVGLYFQNFS